MLQDWLYLVGMKMVSTELMRNIYLNRSNTHGVLAVTCLSPECKFAVSLICGSRYCKIFSLALYKKTNKANK